MEYNSGALMSLDAPTHRKSHFKIAEADDYPRLKHVQLRTSVKGKEDLLSRYAMQQLENSGRALSC